MVHWDDYYRPEGAECGCACLGAPEPLLAAKIVLDPGHGGIYSGAVHYGIREADINLSVALKLRRKLAMLGATVIMTRTRDVNLAPAGSALAADLKARVDVAKTSGADIFVSLHSDSSPNINLAGPTGYFPEKRSFALAGAIYNSLADSICIGNGVSPANFYVLVNNAVPAALIEMGYLSNPAEALCLIDHAYQDLLADKLCKGIMNYFMER